ncbi:hypothetical protein VSH64_34740 [Amycolatopsis rhabdoformis]|uniref:WXG100 family type VII secretion target n=1 Tax=Amycolatopsis rhabdoformis TaxID=1448059 RepID=A0ABZ1I0N6_9PSEU|nr:hypothetical protein [Amycolatopsis rhabdoformis]WSE27975.1 hypothetical protein VSH64_34740 [Amycolatopsis rhabdoformis]
MYTPPDPFGPSGPEEFTGLLDDLFRKVEDKVKEIVDNLAYWEGGGATEYRNRAQAQREAVEAIGGQGGKADAISAWLITIAKLNVKFMTSLLGMVANFVGKLVEAALEAATVVELPFTVKDLAGAIGGLVTDGINGLGTIANQLMESVGSIRDAKGLMNDPRLPGGLWPQAVNL